MSVEFEKDDRGIRVHERGVIAQLCSWFRSHEQGLPEWFKNASTAYARHNVETAHRVITLMFGKRPQDGASYIALLDHGGMTVEDVENRFANWGDPAAYNLDADTEELLEGGHGNGGKCYMTQMFELVSYLHTVKNGRGCRYGFVGDDPYPGYFPSKERGRGFPVADVTDELRRALSELGVDFLKLSDEARLAAAATGGFTLVAGIQPKHIDSAATFRKLAGETLVDHAQMILTLNTNRIFVLIDGKADREYWPLQLPRIEPHEYAPAPRTVQIPASLRDPVSGDQCPTIADGGQAGRLILLTSKTSMRRGPRRGRHNTRFFAYRLPVGFMQMEDISRSTWVDRMYGECHLDILTRYETSDRSGLADAPLTRALKEWVKDQVFAYEAEFNKRDQLQASQQHKNRLQELNQLFDQWKNRFLDEADFGVGDGGTPGKATRRTTPKRPLPAKPATRVSVSCQYSKAGIGVWLRLKADFFAADGDKVAQPGFLWHSSDWAVATVDSKQGIVTHGPGTVDIWLETVDRRLRSDPVRIDVLDIVSAEVEPNNLELQAGEIRELGVRVQDRAGNKHEGVFMTWLQDDSSVLAITATGKVIGRKPGATTVMALDERCVNNPGAAHITIVPPDVGTGDQPGKAYPKILMSEIDPDPLHPDKEPYQLAPEDGPVHQPTPQHVERNIWFINLRCPLAKLYFEEYGPDSTEWRSYHIERYIEALAKIRLNLDFRLADEELTFDEVERRWREIAAEVQKRALEDLREILQGGELRSS